MPDGLVSVAQIDVDFSSDLLDSAHHPRTLAMDIATTTPEHVKTAMRKMKKVPVCIKATLLKGCKDQGAYIQFNEDVRFGLWGALLSAESYEKDGMYAEGTVHDAMDAFFKTDTVKKILTAIVA